ncbi:MAG: PIN domain nuclease [Desulfobacter postgatei]|uniref:PIN domain nuclease n=1 Tax=Desulfobacter postgatei TaxID=2293 RepID=A0A2G6MTE0_9BACT|nr:MAG: PIN domain nuclease [Desulfobacter postgatei]
MSAITPWEIAKKISLGKLALSLPLADWLAAATHSEGLTILPLSVDISIDSNSLPGQFHRDPADQIIVATARKHNLELITADSRILAYPHVRTLKAA